MKESRYFYEPDVENEGIISNEEASHAVKVLRLKEGDECYLIDGKGHFYKVELMLVSPHKCRYRVIEKNFWKKTWNGNITLAIAPTKMIERMEWLVEKATEIGIDEFIFLFCQHSERKILKNERLKRIAISAMKQSRKAILPVVSNMLDFTRFVEGEREGLKFIAHCYEEIERANFFDEINKIDININKNITILIGPEGDFSINEVRLAISKGYVSVSLGESRLRTETAGLFSVMGANVLFSKNTL